MDLSAIRRIVLEAVERLGLTAAAPLWETALVADGSLRGYRFEFDAVRAFWFLQSRTVELYTPEWRQLKVIELARLPTAEVA